MPEVGWGVIGCGDVANKLVAPAITAARRSRLVAFLSSDLERAKDYASRLGAARAYDSMADFLADPDVSAVFVTSRHNEHMRHSIMAAEAGKHVLCEKPMGLSTEECRRIIEACERNGVWLAAAYRQRFYPKNAKVKQLIDEGAIGRVIFVSAIHAHDYDPSPADPKSWRMDAAVSGGGPMVDGGSHLIDLFCYWLGSPAWVMALAENVLQRHAVDDSDSVLIRMASGTQVVSTFHSNVGSVLNRTEIFGTSGRITVALGIAPELTVRTRDGEDTISLPLSGNADVPMVEDFTSAILDGRPPRFDGRDGALTTQIVDAAYESSRLGCRVPIDPRSLEADALPESSGGASRAGAQPG